MRKRIVSCLLFVMLVYLSGIGHAVHRLEVEFSADVIETYPKDPSKNFKGTIHVNKDIMWKDFFHDNQRAVIIIDLIKQTAWMLMPAAKTYQVMEEGEMRGL